MKIETMHAIAIVIQSLVARISSTYRSTYRRIGMGFGLLSGVAIALILAFSFFNPPTELVLIDASVSNPEFFLSQLHSDQQGVMLPNQSNLASITHQLQQHKNLKAIHVISHGAPGQVQIGQTTISADSVEHPDQQHLLTQWQRILSPDGDLFFYGCEIGATDQGQVLLTKLHHLTQADIAASTTLSGDPSLNGDWVLEASIGSVSAPLAIAGEYDAVLRQMTVTTSADDGVGSLRWAIAAANLTPEDDLIELQTLTEPIVLRSPLPLVNSNLYLFGNGATLSGNEQFRVLHAKDSSLVIRDLTIADGLARGADGAGTAGGSAGLGGGLFIEHGDAILSHVTLMNNRAAGGQGGSRSAPVPETLPTSARPLSTHLDIGNEDFNVNRGAIAGLNGVSIPTPTQSADNADRLSSEFGQFTISGTAKKFSANRGAIAGVNGIGVNGIGSIAFGGGGGFGGFGNAGNGGNGGNGGTEGGSGGNGGDGGDGGIGIFGGFGRWDENGGIGTIAFGGGGGFGGFGNAGNGGNGGNAIAPIAQGGNGGNGGNGGFGGGGGGGGFGGQGGHGSKTGQAGVAGTGGFGGGDGEVGNGGGGAGFGGAIFLKASRLILNHTVFDQNAAIAGQGAHPGASHGSSIFIWSGQGQSADDTPPVRAISLGGAPIFRQGHTQSTQSNDVFGSLTVFGGS